MERKKKKRELVKVDDDMEKKEGGARVH